LLNIYLIAKSIYLKQEVDCVVE